MKKIVIATKNLGKFREMSAAISQLNVKILSLNDFENLPDAIEDGKTFEENAVIKAKFYQKITGLACLADDSGLEVEILGGEPGVNSARFAGYHADDGTNNQILVKKLKKINIFESKADYRCALCYFDGKNEIITDGRVDGKIKIKPRGNGGFGYDPYFYLENGKTMAELSAEEKEKISHRGEALRKILPILEEIIKKMG